MGSKGLERIIVRARRARSLALYGSKSSTFSIVWVRKAGRLALYDSQGSEFSSELSIIWARKA